jgi:hypothetical protein
MLPCRPCDSGEVIARQGTRRQLVLRTAVTPPGPPSGASRSQPELWLRVSSVFSRLAARASATGRKKESREKEESRFEWGQRLLRSFVRIRSFCLRGADRFGPWPPHRPICARTAARVKRVGSGPQRGAETACACGLFDRAVGRMESVSPAFASAATVRTLARPARTPSPRDPPPGRRLRSGERSTYRRSGYGSCRRTRPRTRRSDSYLGA